MTVETFDTPGAVTSWVAPQGVISVDVECQGAGGGGANATAANEGGGGGGGAYAAKFSVVVVPGASYTVTVGAGGAGGTGALGAAGGVGGHSQFGSGFIWAAGGNGGVSVNGGAGGTVAGSAGDPGKVVAGTVGDGGGAGTGGGGAGANGTTVGGSFAGGAGGTAVPNGAEGQPGGTPGGGGSGGNNGNGGAGFPGGAGGDGRVRLTYTALEPNAGTASGGFAFAGSATGEAPDAGVSQGTASGTWTFAGSATGATTYQGSASGGFNWFGTAEGPAGAVEHIEDWADLNDVNDTSVQVSGNRLYANASFGDAGYTKAFAFPPTGIWRYQQLIYNVDAGLQNPTIKLGISCGTAGSGVIDDDPDAVGIAMEFATRARASFKGTNLSAVDILDEQIVGVGPSVDATLLFDITADETSISFSLKDVAAVREMIAFRINRSDLADAGKTVNKIYAYFIDARGLSGSSLSPFIFQTGSIGPTPTGTVAGQQIEGAGQRIIATTEDDASPMDWWIATPPDMTADTPVIIHVPQSLSGDGHDAWTETRMTSITTAVMGGYIWASSTDTADRFGNQIELDNYLALHDWVMEHFGGNRDVYLFGTSMGTMACITLVGRGIINARASAVIGFAGGFIWLWHNVTEKRPEIRAAYGFEGDPTDTELRAFTAGYDPLESFVDDVDFDGVGFRFYGGQDDTITPTHLSDTMAGIVLDANATEAGAVYEPGGHLQSDQFQGDDLVAFYQRNASPQSGTASGGFDFAGTATGVAPAIDTATGTASGAWAFAGTASGERDSAGTATGSWNFAGTASGITDRAGSANGAYTFAGAATGEATHEGAASGGYAYTGSATGETHPQGTATGGYLFDGSASGQSDRAGTVTGSWNFAGDAEGTNGEGNRATGTYGWAGTAEGAADYQGSIAGGFNFAGTATGGTSASGTASSSHLWTGSAAGRTTHRGTCTGGWSFTGTATGHADRHGSASGTHGWTGVAAGTTTRSGTASGTHTWHGSATGQAQPVIPPHHVRATITSQGGTARITSRTYAKAVIV